MNFKKITSTLLVISFLAWGVVSVAPQSTASAAPAAMTSMGATLSKQAACSGLNQVDRSTEADCGNLEKGGTGITRIISAIVRILSYVVGIVAVIMIVVAGFKYITSGGDSGRVSSAKSTLIYALVGLAVAALAQFLVTFVLSAT